MNQYTEYKITIKFTSSYITPLQSDTLWGHIAWAIKNLTWNGTEDKLMDFLSLYDKNPEYPPLLVSNGFPSGYFPKPLLPPIFQDEIDDIVENDINEMVKNAYWIKAAREFPYLILKDFENFQNQGFSNFEVFKLIYTKLTESQREYLKLLDDNSFTIQHNTINRITGIVESGLYSQKETFVDTFSQSYDIYIKTNYFTQKELEYIFNYISLEGFGKNKTKGKGNLKIENITKIKLKHAENSNAFVSLSSFIPKETDPTDGYYNTILKYGKLGGTYAMGDPEAGGIPFKKPLLMFTAGSVFHDISFIKEKIYGSLISDVHKINKNIKHYAYAFPIGIIWEDKNETIQFKG